MGEVTGALKMFKQNVVRDTANIATAPFSHAFSELLNKKWNEINARNKAQADDTQGSGKNNAPQHNDNEPKHDNDNQKDNQKSEADKQRQKPIPQTKKKDFSQHGHTLTNV